MNGFTEENRLEGTVSALVFQNKENGYTVLRMDTEGFGTVNVVGVIPLSSVGERLTVVGRWTRHPAHGEQFQADTVERMLPEGSGAILKYLASGTVKGIGVSTAKKLVDQFGDATLDVLENHEELVAQVKGISKNKAAEICAAFKRQTGIRRLIEYIAAHELPVSAAMRLYKNFGELSRSILEENPYILTDDDYGVSFSDVDRFAIATGVDGRSEMRLDAGVLFELRHNLKNGHTFIPREKLLSATARLLDVETGELEQSLERLSESGGIVIDVIAGETACYLDSFYETEVYVAKRILQMCESRLTPPDNVESVIEFSQRAAEIEYAPAQKEAVRLAAGHQLMILTGGPGTGKTTTVRAILSLFDAMKLDTALAAPTGRAAKRMSELCGREATTIHRLLEVQFIDDNGRMLFCHDESEPVAADALIIDETSMLDLALMRALLAALKPEGRLILVGDADQLPSVGAGNLFSDLIRSSRIATVRLEEIFRQAQKSGIVLNAHAVNKGMMPDLTKKDGDFFFLKRKNSASLIETLTQLCGTRLPGNMNIPPEDIQVLAPTRKFDTGAVNLNRELQKALNPPNAGKKEKRHGEFVFREGDRVMQIKNNYDIMWKRQSEKGSGIYNGDIGRIGTIDNLSQTMLISFDDRVVEYDFELLDELELAYAMTVHKAQGSEYRAVILSLLQGPPMLLSRAVLYTALTRARELLIIVGDEQIVYGMAANNRQMKRYTGLRARLAGG